MIESVWDNAPQKLAAKQSVSQQKQPDQSFQKSYDSSQSQYSSPFDSAPDTAYGQNYNQLNMGDDGIQPLLSSLKGKHSNNALFLTGNNLTDKSLAQLSQALKQDQVVKHLILSKNKLVISEFAKAGVMDLLKTNHYIGWLVLGHNEIQSEGAKTLAAALRKNKGIKHVVLSHNQIEDDGVIALAESLVDHPTIESLFLAANPVTEASIPALKKLISQSKTLKKLDLRGTKISKQAQDLLRHFCDSKGVSLS